MIGTAPLSKYTGVPGWQEPQEEEALISLARQYVPFHDGVIVEIGGEYGRSAAEFAYACEGCENIRIVTVDLFPGNHHIAGQHGGLLAVWRHNLIEAGIQNYTNVTLVPIRGDSGEIGNSWNTPIDCLFIDGDHTYEGVKRDIEAWTPHVKVGGVVIYHDVAKDGNAHYLHIEILRAVTDWYQNKNFVYWRPLPELPDSLSAFIRVKADGTNDEPQTAVESSASTPEKPAKKTRKPRKVK